MQTPIIAEKAANSGLNPPPPLAKGSTNEAMEGKCSELLPKGAVARARAAESNELTKVASRAEPDNGGARARMLILVL